MLGRSSVDGVACLVNSVSVCEEKREKDGTEKRKMKEKSREKMKVEMKEKMKRDKGEKMFPF